MLFHVIWRSDIKLYMWKNIFETNIPCNSDVFMEFSVWIWKTSPFLQKMMIYVFVSQQQLTFFLCVQNACYSTDSVIYEFHSRFVYTSSHIPYAGKHFERIKGKIYLSIILKMPFSKFLCEFKTTVDSSMINVNWTRNSELRWQNDGN